MRIHGFDYLRCLAACGIVWFHADTVAPRRGIGYAGLPVFCVLTFFLLAQSLARQPVAEFVRKRARRLAVPFVAWSLFYYVEHAAVLGALPELKPLDLLAGTSIHLWYLSFVLIASLVLAAVARAMRRNAYALGSVATCGLALVAVPGSLDGLPTPIGQWWYALPAALIGLALGSTPSLRERRIFAGFVAPAALLLAVLAYARHPIDALSYAIGLPLAIGASLVELPAIPLVATLADLTLGVYVLHPFWFDVCFALGAPELQIRIPVAIAGSAAATAVLRRLPGGQWLV